MNSKKAELLALADALVERPVFFTRDKNMWHKAAAALREYAGTMEQEPVAWRAKAQCGMYSGMWEFSEDKTDLIDAQPLYLHPRAPSRVPLTDEEIKDFANMQPDHMEYPDYIDFARAIEQAHGIK
jgi:hypothetical protein